MKLLAYALAAVALRKLRDIHTQTMDLAIQFVVPRPGEP